MSEKYSTEQRLARIRSSQSYKSLEWFTASDMHRNMPSISLTHVQDLLRQLYLKGDLSREVIHYGNNRVVKYKAFNLNLVNRPWRSSIPPIIYGSPTWPPVIPGILDSSLADQHQAEDV